MADKSSIEWTDATWNPLVGCSRVSEGCQHCYAERHAYRFSGVPGVYEGTSRLVNGHPTFTGRVNFNERVLDLPLRWRRPRKIFVNAFSDLFHENVSDETRDRVFAVMALASQHTFQVLTKRAGRMRDYCASDATLVRVWREVARCIDGVPGASARLEHKADGLSGLCLDNVWLGVSVEHQAAADERIPLLLQTPAAVRFLSCEPLLGRVDLCEHLGMWWNQTMQCFEGTGSRINASHFMGQQRIGWVIAGGESGPGARPMHPDWARSLRDQCAAAQVPFFFKQWGEWLAGTQYEDEHRRADPGDFSRFESREWDGDKWDGHDELEPSSAEVVYRIGKKRAGHLLDGVEHHAFPEPRT